MSIIYQKNITDVENRVKRKTDGFTLIELLVVVLIIGILAAIALPQYEKVVGITKVKTLLPLMRSIAEAEKVFYLANGQYTSFFGELDISMPAGGEINISSEGTESVLYTNFTCYIHKNNDGAASIYCSSKKVSNISLERYFTSSRFICWASKEDRLAHSICQNISGLTTHNTTSGSGGKGYVF